MDYIFSLCVVTNVESILHGVQGPGFYRISRLVGKIGASVKEPDSARIRVLEQALTLFEGITGYRSRRFAQPPTSTSPGVLTGNAVVAS